ncbi:dihydrodipicolinate synthase family protein [Mesorhizobium sp. M1143]|uniref:dihydrodipicolinate synthase family protein n=1 Tax=Mesorhizobium sp. M1143 TaxID=2957061 RepID=UPI003336BEF6
MAFLSGLSAFPITPTNRDGRVDSVALRRLIARLGIAQVDSIGLLGSTGTYICLSREQRRRALSETLDQTAGQMPVVVGVGALRTDDDVGLAHFSTVARESGLPIVVYDNPGTTHFHFSPPLVSRLAKVAGIVAIKNPTDKSDAIKNHLTAQRRTLPEGFSIGYSGDWNAAEAMIAGADTWYSVLAGILPEVCMTIVTAAQQGDAAEARRINAALVPIWSLFKEFSSLRVVYALAELLDVCSAEPPRPILPLPPAAKRQIAAALKGLPSDASR